MSDLVLVVKSIPYVKINNPLVLECVIDGVTTDLRAGQWRLHSRAIATRLAEYRLVKTTAHLNEVHYHYINVADSVAHQLEVVRGLIGQGLLNRALSVLDGLDVPLSEAVYADDLRDVINRRMSAEKRGYPSAAASAPQCTPHYRQARI